jgi:hypothetical protein
MFMLTDSQEVSFNVTGQSAAGNEAPLENVQVVSSDPSVVAVSGSAESGFILSSQGRVGVAQINIQADARIGDGEKILTGTEEIQVVSGEAAVLRPVFGTPTEKI